VGWRVVAQRKYTHVSKFKNDKIKLKQINKMTVKKIKTSSKREMVCKMVNP
jgi:hypothetical protein